MQIYVIDCSLTMSWCFRDEKTEYTSRLREALPHSVLFVPKLWDLEVLNVLLISERRNRLSNHDVAEFLGFLRALPINKDRQFSETQLESTLSLARENRLTAYDASYLELAMRLSLPLATLDQELQIAAQRMGVPLVQ